MEASKSKIVVFLLLTLNVSSCLISHEKPELKVSEENYINEEAPKSSRSSIDKSIPANVLMKRLKRNSRAVKKHICTVLHKNPKLKLNQTDPENLVELLINGTHLLNRQYFPANVTLLIGKMGNEKTSLAKLLVNDISDLKVVKSYTKQHVIYAGNILKDHHDAHTLVPKIHHPKSDEDTVTVTDSFVEFPLFLVKTGKNVSSNSIALQYFTREFFKRVDFVKTLLIIPHGSVRSASASSLSEFDVLATHLVAILRYYPSHNNSIGLVVTRLEKSEPAITNEAIKIETLAFLIKYLQNLTQTLSLSNATDDDDDAAKEVINQKIKLIEALTKEDPAGQSITSRIVLFKTPPKCGPVNESQPIKQLRNEVLNFINNALQYSKVSLDSNWSKRFSDEDKMFVKNSVLHLTKHVAQEMSTITSTFMDDYSARKFKVHNFTRALQSMKRVETYLSGVLGLRYEKIWDVVDLLFEIYKKLNAALPARLKHKVKVLQTFFEFEDELNSPGIMQVVEYWTSSAVNLKSFLGKKIGNGGFLSGSQLKLSGLDAEIVHIGEQTELQIELWKTNHSAFEEAELEKKAKVDERMEYVKKALAELVELAPKRKCKALKPNKDTRINALGLLLACQERNVDGVKAFLQLGANPNNSNDEEGRETALFVACSQRNRTNNNNNKLTIIAITKLLIKHGANVYKGAEENQTFLHQLLSGTDPITPEEFQDLVEFLGGNKSINMLGRGDNDPFNYALQKIKITEATLDLMKQHMFSFDLPGKGFEYLRSGVEHGHGYKFLSKLIDYVKDYQSKKVANGGNLYHLAAQVFNFEAIDVLKAKGTNLKIDKINEDGLTPLHLALVSFTSKKYPERVDKFGEVVKSLIKAGADVNIREGKTNRSVYEIAKEAEGVSEEILSLLKGKE